MALCAGNSPVTGKFPVQRPVTRSFDVSFDLRLNKPLGKQSWGFWFETPSRSLWRHCDASGRNPEHHCRDPDANSTNTSTSLPSENSASQCSLFDNATQQASPCSNGWVYENFPRERSMVMEVLEIFYLVLRKREITHHDAYWNGNVIPTYWYFCTRICQNDKPSTASNEISVRVGFTNPSYFRHILSITSPLS